jgi:hypothetical protein
VSITGEHFGIVLSHEDRPGVPMGIRFIRGSRLGTHVSSQWQLRIQYRVPISVRRTAGIGATSPLPCLSAKVPSPPDLQTFAIVRCYRRNRYFARNELSRLCLGVLRTAEGEPLSTDDIAGRVIVAKAFDLATLSCVPQSAIRSEI